jgi:hypothetical protein
VTSIATAAPALRELMASEIDWELGAAPMDTNVSQAGADILADAVIDALAYRLALLESIDALRRLTLQNDRLRARRAEVSTSSNLPDRVTGKDGAR